MVKIPSKRILSNIKEVDNESDDCSLSLATNKTNMNQISRPISFNSSNIHVKPQSSIKSVKSNESLQVKFYEKLAQNEEAKKMSGLDKLSHKLSPVKGFIFAFLTAIFFSLSNIAIKKGSLLTGSEHLVILFFLKIILMLIVISYNKLNPFGPKGTRLLLSIRGLTGLFGLIFFYFGILFIPPSDASAIGHSSIIITCILARIFLKEKLEIAHFFALIFTIIGVIFISKPSILFPEKYMFTFSSLSSNVTNNVNQSIFADNSTSSISHMVAADHKYLTFIFGIIMIIMSAFFFGMLQIFIKKLCNSNVHWSVNTTYAAYYGLPISILISIGLVQSGFSHRNFAQEKDLILVNVFYSALSALFGIIGQVCVNIALSYEDASKVAIAKTSDVLIQFALQMFILNINVDLFSIVGSLAIVLGTFIVLSFKIIESKVAKSNSKKKNCFTKCVMIKV